MVQPLTARVITTLACRRACPYCVNRHPGMLESARRVRSLAAIAPYGPFEAVVLTGGEPLLNVSRTIELAGQARRLYPGRPVYLYSAHYPGSIDMRAVLQAVDGITYTVHDDATWEQCRVVGPIQKMLEEYSRGGASRLVIGTKVRYSVALRPTVWGRVKMEAWKEPGFCPLPYNERLFMLEDA